MFELLDEIKDKWKESKFVIISQTFREVNYSYFVIPSQAVRYDHIRYLRTNENGDIRVTIPDEISRVLGIPSLDNLLEGIIVRYPIIGRLKEIGQLNHGYSISISNRKVKTGIEDKDKSLTIHTLGDFVDNNFSRSKSAKEIKRNFTQTFKIPGEVKLIRGIHGTLKRDNSIAELSLVMNDLTNHAKTSLISPIICNDNNYKKCVKQIAIREEIPIITDREIVNLWRSIKKIDKNKILWMSGAKGE